jgi:hypothetical protein
MEMEEGKEFILNGKNVERDEVFSKSVRAGKRTYFFDVKATRKNEYYLTITESKKRFNKEGRYFYEKHKVFLYKEDFDKFQDGLSEVLDFIRNSNNQGLPEVAVEDVLETTSEKDYTDIEFEDLEVGVAAEESAKE